jgi:hypothetical protein
MEARQTRVLQAFERVQTFLVNNAALLSAIPQSAPALALTAVVTNLAGNGAAQGIAKIQTKGAVGTQTALRRALIVTNMRPIVAIAKDQAGALPATLGLVMPKPHVNVTQLVADATAMAVAVAPYAQTFITGGLPATFIADLQTAAAALNAAANLKGTSKTNSVLATTGVADQEKQGRSTLNILNTLVQSALAGNVPALAQWKNAKRITPQPASTTATPVTPTPVPASTTESAAPAATTTPTAEVKAA